MILKGQISLLFLIKKKSRTGIKLENEVEHFLMLFSYSTIVQ